MVVNKNLLWLYLSQKKKKKPLVLSIYYDCAI